MQWKIELFRLPARPGATEDAIGQGSWLTSMLEAEGQAAEREPRRAFQ